MPKLLSENTGTNAQWDNSLIKDLAFIREHLRYPFNKRTMGISIVLRLLLPLLSGITLITIQVAYSKKLSTLNHILLPVFWGLFTLSGIVAGFRRYKETLKFAVIHNPFYATQNQNMIVRFLESEHLAVYRHPDAPEVLQIISKNMSPGKGDYREVMIFIADEKRILINSHFTSGFSSPPSKQSKQMADRLNQWIKIHHADPENQAIAVQHF